MDRSGGDEKHVAGLQRGGRLALDLVFQRAFEDVDDLFARMGVAAEGRARRKVDADLERLVAGDAEIVPLQIGSRDSPGLLRPRDVRTPTALPSISAAIAKARAVFINLSLMSTPSRFTAATPRRPAP